MSRNNLTEANLQEANVKKANNTKVQNVAIREVVAKEEAYQNLLRRYWELEAGAQGHHKAETNTTNVTYTIETTKVPIKEENYSKYPIHLVDGTAFGGILAGLQTISNPLHRQVLTNTFQSMGANFINQSMQQTQQNAAARQQASANASGQAPAEQNVAKQEAVNQEAANQEVPNQNINQDTSSHEEDQTKDVDNDSSNEANDGYEFSENASDNSSNHYSQEEDELDRVYDFLVNTYCREDVREFFTIIKSTFLGDLRFHSANAQISSVKIIQESGVQVISIVTSSYDSLNRKHSDVTSKLTRVTDYPGSFVNEAAETHRQERKNGLNTSKTPTFTRTE